MQDESVLTPGELAAYLKISKRQLWRLRDCGALPMPDTIGGSERCLRWRADIIRQWTRAGMPDVRRTGWKSTETARR